MPKKLLSEIMDEVIEFKAEMMQKYVLEMLLMPEIDIGTPEEFAEKKAELWTERDKMLLSQQFPSKEIIKAQLLARYEELKKKEQEVKDLEGYHGK